MPGEIGATSISDRSGVPYPARSAPPGSGNRSRRLGGGPVVGEWVPTIPDTEVRAVGRCVLGTERAAQEVGVALVMAPEIEAGMEHELRLRRQAQDPSPANFAGAEDGRTATVRGLPDRATLAQCRRQLRRLEVDEIDATPCAVVHHRPAGHPSGGRVPGEDLPESQMTQGGPCSWLVPFELQQHQIQVMVPSCSTADEGVDTPSAAHDAGDSGTLHRIENPEDVPFPHVRRMEPSPSPTQEWGQRRRSDDPSKGSPDGQQPGVGADPMFEPVQGATGESARRGLTAEGGWMSHWVVDSLTSGPSGAGRTGRSRCWSIDRSPRDLEGSSTAPSRSRASMGPGVTRTGLGRSGGQRVLGRGATVRCRR